MNDSPYIFSGSSQACGPTYSPEQEAKWKKEIEEEEKERIKNLKARIRRNLKKATSDKELNQIIFELTEEIREENSEW